MRSSAAIAEPAGIFAGDLATFAGLLGERPRPGDTSLSDLCRPEGLAAPLGRHARTLGTLHKEAAASLWSQYALMRLIVPMTASIVAGRLRPAGPWKAIRVTLCPTTGLPLRFSMPLGPAASEHDLADFMDTTLAPLIARMAPPLGLGRRLLWENAARPFAWTIGVLERSHSGACGDLVRRIGDAKALWPQAFEPCGRRTCCLRHHLPGFAKCEGLCPLLARA